MKKQELVHLHALLAEVRAAYEDRTGRPLEPDEYDRLGVRPTSIHRSKDDHEAAVVLLASALADATDDAANGPRADASD
ncbi:MAG: UPF0058 family protein [Haloferacaceae archaeon]